MTSKRSLKALTKAIDKKVARMRLDIEGSVFSRPETLTWTPASTKPDADITVLCWDGEEWFSGWWDDAWFDAASGGTVEHVTHWAHVEGPQ